MAAACTKEQRQERGRSSGPPSSRPVSGLTNGGMSPGVNGSQGINGSSTHATPHSLDHSTSGLSTPSTLSPGEGFAGSLEDEFNKVIWVAVAISSAENYPHFSSNSFTNSPSILNVVLFCVYVCYILFIA